MLFIHGARAAMPGRAKQDTPLGAWLRGLLTRTHRNVAIVALANKLARIAWATLRRGASGSNLKGLSPRPEPQRDRRSLSGVSQEVCEAEGGGLRCRQASGEAQDTLAGRYTEGLPLRVVVHPAGI